MKSNNAFRATFAAVALLGAAQLAGCSDGQASVSEEAETPVAAVPVETATPVQSDINATYSASASIASDIDAPVTARVSGQVVELLVEEGDRVKAGQILARLDGERLRLEMLSAKANLERAEKEVQRNEDLHKRGLVSAAMFEGLKFDLDSLQATYDLKRLTYDYSRIRAPISGIVSSREIKPGENLIVGQVAYRITETSELIAHLQIPQTELAKFGIGHPATVTVAAMPETRFDASIIRISPTIDIETGTFRATALIENAEGDLAPGMFGRFTIAYERHEGVMTIPVAALLDEDEVTSVYVVENGEVSKRQIEIGIEEDGQLEILGGLGADDEVVIAGHSGLRDGSKVLAKANDDTRNIG